MNEGLFRPLKKHRLKPLLKLHNVRQAQAADKLGVSLAYFNSVLNGHTKPSKQLEEDMAVLTVKMSPDETLIPSSYDEDE
jgi:transcriptional regulator with XRE-family HTH domain|tara:strand:+ start:7606 stop:7845 length:240 start_codon:yes stop_codon:yes gene_type:complete